MSSSMNRNFNNKNAVTPNNHGEENPYNRSYGPNHGPPQSDHRGDVSSHQMHMNNGKPYPPPMPLVHEDEGGRNRPPSAHRREGEHYNGYHSNYNGYEGPGPGPAPPPSYPHYGAPPPANRGDVEWNNYPRHDYSDPEQDHWRSNDYGPPPAGSGKSAPPPSSGPPMPSYGSYYPEERHPASHPHGPPPRPPHDNRMYRKGSDHERPHYSHGPPQDRDLADSYAPPPYEGAPSGEGSPYMYPHKSRYSYSQPQRPPHSQPPPPQPNKDQVIFRNSYVDGPPPSQGSMRSDEVHTFVTADEGHPPPPRYNQERSHRSEEYEHSHQHHPGQPKNLHSYDQPHSHPGHFDEPPPEVVHMVSPHRRGHVPPRHHRQFSSESENMSSYDYPPHPNHNNPPPPHPPMNHHYYPAPSYSYASNSPMCRSMYGPPAPGPMPTPYHPHSHYPPHHSYYPHSNPHPIPLTLTNSHSFESSNRSSPPPIPQATHPTCQSIADVNANDVLCGRGGGTNSQIGNRKFRKLVQQYQPEYLVARRKTKPHISRKIVQIVRKAGGRFLKKEESTGYLYEVGDERAEAKTSQALREGLDVRSCAGGKKKEEPQGRDTPVLKNTEQHHHEQQQQSGQKRELPSDSDKVQQQDSEKTTPATNADGKEWEDFSPPRSKMKLDHEDTTSDPEPPKVESSVKEENIKEDSIENQAKIWPTTAV